MKFWGDFKALLEAFLGFDRDLLHIPVGVVLFVVFFVLFRRRRRPMVWAFFGLLIVQVLNEIVDFANSGAAPGVVWWGEHISDTVLTVFFPGMFLCVVLILKWGVPRKDGPFWSVVEQEPGRNGEQNSPDS